MITNKETIISKLKDTQGEFAIVQNPANIYPLEEYYLLANKLPLVESIKAVLMDMDGTTTTTEELCIYSLETMVRRISGRLTKADWLGFIPEKDYPNIIGNSTTKHVEYLIKTYSSAVNNQNVKVEFLKAAVWTILNGQDEKRKQEVIQNIRRLNIQSFVDDLNNGQTEEQLVVKYQDKLTDLDFTEIVSLSIDIYYQEYHKILARLANGEGDKVKHQVFGSDHSHKELIAPMPGIPVIIPMLKGWLGSDIDYLTNDFFNLLHQKNPNLNINAKEYQQKLIKLSNYFEKNPAKLALVTSSIFYEANIVVGELYKGMVDFYKKSVLPTSRKDFIINKLNSYSNVYDAFITATDSNEIRLKPHRDLYSIALQQIGLLPTDFDKVVGFEDSQSGTVALRAAGIGCCIAVPFAQTVNHNFEAASDIAKNGIPEVLILKNLYLNQK